MLTWRITYIRESVTIFSNIYFIMSKLHCSAEITCSQTIQFINLSYFYTYFKRETLVAISGAREVIPQREAPSLKSAQSEGERGIPQGRGRGSAREKKEALVCEERSRSRPTCVECLVQGFVREREFSGNPGCQREFVSLELANACHFQLSKLTLPLFFLF